MQIANFTFSSAPIQLSSSVRASNFGAPEKTSLTSASERVDTPSKPPGSASNNPTSFSFSGVSGVNASPPPLYSPGIRNAGIAPESVGANEPDNGEANRGEVSAVPGGVDDTSEAAQGAVRAEPEPEPESQNGPNLDAGNTVARENGSSEDQAREKQQEQVVQKAVAELSARDAEVRAHERAHQAVGGPYAGAVSYSYQTGPDGKRYAVSGEVPIDVSPVPGDPRATIEKMRVVKAAATAPAKPSTQDLNVAATATRILVQAQIELAAQRQEEREVADTSEGRNRFAEAARRYEEIIGLGRADIDVRDVIDETV